MQELLVFLIVIAAVAYIARQTWQAWRGKKSCCESGCGKRAKTSSTPIPEHLVQISLNGKTLPVQHGDKAQNSSLN